MLILFNRHYVLVRLALAVLLTAWSGTAAAGIKPGDALPDLATFGLEGKLPASLQNKVVLLDFWASWCDPCKESFPVMEELQKRYGPEGFIVIAVNVDEKRADMEAFLKRTPATILVLRDAKQKLVDKADIGTMPSSFLVDRTGKVRYIHSGFKGAETKQKYAEEIETLLKR